MVNQVAKGAVKSPDNQRFCCHPDGPETVSGFPQRQAAIAAGSVSSFPVPYIKVFFSAGLALKFIGLYNNHDIWVRSIPGTVLAHDTMKGNALFIPFI